MAEGWRHPHDEAVAGDRVMFRRAGDGRRNNAASRRCDAQAVSNAMRADVGGSARTKAALIAAHFPAGRGRRISAFTGRSSLSSLKQSGESTNLFIVQSSNSREERAFDETMQARSAFRCVKHFSTLPLRRR